MKLYTAKIFSRDAEESLKRYKDLLQDFKAVIKCDDDKNDLPWAVSYGCWIELEVKTLEDFKKVLRALDESVIVEVRGEELVGVVYDYWIE